MICKGIWPECANSTFLIKVSRESPKYSLILHQPNSNLPRQPSLTSLISLPSPNNPVILVSKTLLRRRDREISAQITRPVAQVTHSVLTDSLLFNMQRFPTRHRITGFAIWRMRFVRKNRRKKSSAEESAVNVDLRSRTRRRKITASATIARFNWK